MRQRRNVFSRKSWNPAERAIQEQAFFNLEGREWLKRQVATLGRGKFLLRKWSVMTPAVKKKAFELSYRRTAMESVIRIVDFSKKIPFQETSDITAARFYGKQTADDIVSGRPIPTFRGARTNLLGCQTFVATTMALLRAAKPISGKISDIVAVRTIAPRGYSGKGKVIGMPHTIAYFKVDGVYFIADPFKQGYSFLGSGFIGKKGKTLIRADEVSKQIELLKEEGLWKEARDPADHRIDSFEKYVIDAEIKGKEVAQGLDLTRFLDEIKGHI